MRRCQPSLVVWVITIVLLAPLVAVASEPGTGDTLEAWLAPILSVDGPPYDQQASGRFENLARFYHHIGFQPVWTTATGLLPQGKQVLQTMFPDRSCFFNTDASAWTGVEDMARNNTSLPPMAPSLNLEPHLKVDAMLTTMVLDYADQAWNGQVRPETVPEEWPRAPHTEIRDFPLELAQAVGQHRLPEFMESLQPANMAYRRLKKALQQYEAIRQAGGWPPLEKGPTLRPGTRSPRVAALVQRLEISGDYTGDQSAGPQRANAFDEHLAAAVKRFQARHGLTPDGVVGNATQEALNVSVDTRIRQLELNMQRWRWYPDDFGARYIVVNIPAFELDLVESGSSVAKMRAVVGKDRRPTPVLASEMTYLEINPYWTVPAKIARKDILPKLIKDPSYLNRQGFRVFAGWDRHAPEIDATSIAWNEVSGSVVIAAKPL